MGRIGCKRGEEAYCDVDWELNVINSISNNNHKI